MSVNLFSSAIEMLRALDSRQLSSVELTELHINRIQGLDGPLNAVVVRDFERALDHARAANAARAEGEKLPMTVKDGFFVAGLSAAAETYSDLRVALLPRFDWLPLADQIASALEA